MNVTGGGAYDNKEVNEKKPGWFMFCKKQNETLHLSAGERKQTLERKERIQSKKRYSKKENETIIAGNINEWCHRLALCNDALFTWFVIIMLVTSQTKVEVRIYEGI